MYKLGGYAKYDMALARWVRAKLHVEDVWPKGIDHAFGDAIYTRGEELKLGKYLLFIDELARYWEESYELFDSKLIKGWGRIVGVIPEPAYWDRKAPGYWIVENDGKVDIIMGNSHRKPIPLSHE